MRAEGRGAHSGGSHRHAAFYAPGMLAREGDTSIPGLTGQPLLQGVWVGEGDRVAVVAPPHPLMGGDLENPGLVDRGRGAGYDARRAPPSSGRPRPGHPVRVIPSQDYVSV